MDRDIDLYAVWRRRSVLVTFNSLTLKEPIEKRIPEGDSVQSHLPDIPMPKGCHIKRWRKLDAETGLYSPDSYDLSSPVTGDITLKPDFERLNAGGNSNAAPKKSAPAVPVNKVGVPKLGAKPAILGARPPIDSEAATNEVPAVAAPAAAPAEERTSDNAAPEPAPEAAPKADPEPADADAATPNE